ncbi:MAG: methyltransferase family protein [Candidatus Hodarchaeota archaeon]
MISFHYSQIFLLIYIIIIVVGYFLTYGRVEGKHEKSISEEYGRQTKAKIFGIGFGLIMLMWIFLIVLYFFVYDSVNWFFKISILDNDLIKIIAMSIMCFAFLLIFLFTINVGKSIKNAEISGEKSQLITSGIYRFIRHPAYTAFILDVFGTFFIIPNLLILSFLLCTVIVMYGHSNEEEKILIKMYGSEYEEYKKKAGRFLPKIKRK